jgi:hypothetical protein
MISNHKLGNSGVPRILCISPYFPPMRDSEAFCSGKFVHALMDSGAEITVIAYADKVGWDGDRSPIWKSLEKVTLRLPTPVRKGRLDLLKKVVQYQTPLWTRWTSAAIEEATRVHRARPFDAIYSRSLPMFGHIVAYWCAQELDLPWIANLNDPWDVRLDPSWTEKEEFSLGTPASSFWMKRTLRNADLVTYPADRLRRHHSKLCPMQHRWKIFPHVGIRTGSSSKSSPGHPPSTFHLVHAGKLGSSTGSGRSPMALLEALRMFLEDFPEARGNVLFTLVGPEDKSTTERIRELGLPGIVVSVGRTDYEESLRHVQSASVCVLVEADIAEGIFLPSKLVDYISAQKPVLALSPRIGEIADLVPGGGITRVDAADAPGIRDAIRGLHQDFRKGTLALRSPSGAQVDQFRPELVANQFLQTVRELIAEKKESKLQRA